MRVWTVVMRSGDAPECAEAMGVWDTEAAALAHATRACRDALMSPAKVLYSDFSVYRPLPNSPDGEIRFDLHGSQHHRIGFIMIIPLVLNRRADGITDRHLKSLLGVYHPLPPDHGCDPDAYEHELRIEAERETDEKRGRIARKLNQAARADTLMCAECNIRFRHVARFLLMLEDYEGWKKLPADEKRLVNEPPWPHPFCKRRDPSGCVSEVAMRVLTEDTADVTPIPLHANAVDVTETGY